MKGTPLRLMFAHIYGRKTSPDQGRSAPAHCGYEPLHIITPASTIAAQLSIGTGVALAYKMQHKPNVVVALSGEGSTSLGSWHEAVNFAGVQRLPIIFVVENNLYAESVPIKLQTAAREISDKAAGYGIAGLTVDGNDVITVYTAMREAINRARGGNGPTMLECKTYRWYGHSEIDPAKYRDPKELELWKARDPIPAMETYLACRELWSEAWKSELAAQFNAELEDAIQFAESSPEPAAEEALDHVFSFSIREREMERPNREPKLSIAASAH
jgi:TPP-dependent pyruvate/acetoin dehydrogenase alpha subunit